MDPYTPQWTPDLHALSELRQVSVTGDDDMAEINRLLAGGWRLVDIGYLNAATVYVLGRADQKPRSPAGFIGRD